LVEEAGCDLDGEVRRTGAVRLATRSRPIPPLGRAIGKGGRR
jgi:hypothetical protein